MTGHFEMRKTPELLRTVMVAALSGRNPGQAGGRRGPDFVRRWLAAQRDHSACQAIGLTFEVWRNGRRNHGREPAAAIQFVRFVMYRTISRAAAALLALCAAGGPAAADDAATCTTAQGDDSIAACTRLLQSNPNSAPVYGYRAVAYYRKGQHDKAFADFDQLVRLAPRDARSYKARGSAHAEIGEYDRGVADFDQAIRLDPKFAAAYNARGQVYNAKGESDR